MNKNPKFSTDMLKIDCEKEVERIAQLLRNTIQKFKKRGLVVALSGGIDSSVVGALCVKTLGKDKVFGLLMPEKDSSPDTIRLSSLIAEHLDINNIHEDITPILESLKCYFHRDEAIKSVIPEYDATYKSKIVLPNLLDTDQYRTFSVIVQSPRGEQKKARLSLSAYLQIVAATNFKQRVRKMLEYYHADRLNYAATGTPNLQEYDQGFFVKLGDGAADVKPIAHLYKTQVYQLAEYLEIPREIQNSVPTTDTYSLSQTQEEFYFSIPYDKFDLCLYGKNHEISSDEVAPAIGLTPQQVDRVYNDIDQKRKTTNYLHATPVLIEKVKKINE
ncbi:NAD(+) synthase [candidate division KSB1 bacterium]|nr:NAD(+) synthase [candidate division KSB1 bacterium]MBL7093232.1 NAD(+) synthase [candidate division KSB1 bacterium]